MVHTSILKIYMCIAILSIASHAFADAMSWQWTMQNGSAGYDDAFGMATQGDNVFIAGEAGGSWDSQSYSGRGDAGTRLYSASGAEMWARLTGNPSNQYVQGCALADTGSVYIAGFTDGSINGETYGGRGDYFLAKYSVNGSLEWVRLDGTDAATAARDVCVDADGNVYITGTTDTSLNGEVFNGAQDAFIIKFNSQGTREWTKLCGSATNEWAEGIACRADTVAIAGTTLGAFNGQSNSGKNDYFIFSCTTNGVDATTVIGGSMEDDYAKDISMNPAKDMYIAGDSYGGYRGTFNGQTNAGLADAFVTKYSSAGAHQWSYMCGTSKGDYARSIHVDEYGYAYVAGFSYGNLFGRSNAGNADAFSFILRPNGTLSDAELRGTPHYEYAEATTYSPDHDHVYIAGETDGGLDGHVSVGNFDTFLIAYLIPEPTCLIFFFSILSYLYYQRKCASASN